MLPLDQGAVVRAVEQARSPTRADDQKNNKELTVPGLENGWQPCLADSFVGLAFFDGIRIDTDRIADPRWNRVLPIQEEEQILMCRAMFQRGRLQPGLRVLDVGTGSGVFAIWAAAHGCKVDGIDISARAINFARQNEAHNCNGARIRSSGGGVAFDRISAEDFASKASGGSHDPYDLVLLNPPYNPTAVGFKPAQHANAGPHGLDIFRKQLPLAWNLLREGGMIIGHQMAFYEWGRATEWWTNELDRAKIQDGYTLEYASTLGGDAEIPAEEFLKRQYKSFLDSGLKLEPPPDKVDKYIRRALDGSIERTVSKAPVFGLFYYEIKKSRSVSRTVRPPAISRFRFSALPAKDWNDRIELHRAIIEHTSAQSSYPVPTLFLRNDFVPSLPRMTSPGMEEKLDGPSPEPSFDDSLLSALGRWMGQVGFFADGAACAAPGRPRGEGPHDTADSPFDFVVVDLSPWFDVLLGKQALRQEAVVYARKDCFEGDDLKRVLRTYQQAIQSQQKLFLGPFFHPRFTGQSGHSSWGVTHYRVMDEPELPSHLLTDKERTMVAGWEQGVERETAVLTPSPDRIEATDEQSFLDKVLIAFDASKTLLDLEVPLVSGYWDRFKRDYGIEREGDRESDEKLRRENDEKLERDLELIHLLFHKRLRGLLGLNTRKNMKTMLLALPLRLATWQEANSIDAVPDSYRGGIWIFAGTRGRFGPKEESMLLDLGRLTLLLASSAVEARATTALSAGLQYDFSGSFAHEIKDVIDAIRVISSKEARSDNGLEQRSRDEQHLERVRDYFYMLALTPQDFGREREDAWLRVVGTAPKGFARGDSWQQLINKHIDIARRADALIKAIKKRTTPKISFSWQPVEDRALGPDYTNTTSRPPVRLKEHYFFCISLIAVFRNLFKHCGSRLNEVTIALVGEVLQVRHTGGAQVRESPKRIGTKSTLQSYVRQYRPGHESSVVFDWVDNRQYWVTAIPLPEGLLCHEIVPD